MILRQGSRLCFTWSILASHLDDDLNAALVGNPIRQQLAHRRRERIFAHIPERRHDFGWPGGDRGRTFILGDGPAQNHSPSAPPGLGNRLVVTLTVLQPITDMRDRELITGTQPASFHPLSIDSNAIGASQVAHRHLAILMAHATVLPGNTKRIKTCVARRVPSHNHHGAVQRDVWTFIECHKSSCGHGEGSSSGAASGDRVVIVRQGLDRYYRSIVFKPASEKLMNRYDPIARFVRPDGSIRSGFPIDQEPRAQVISALDPRYKYKMGNLKRILDTRYF